MSRGVRAWSGPDLFTGGEPEPPPAVPAAAPTTPAATAPARWVPRYREGQIRRVEKAFDIFKDWLFAAELATLQAADVPALARRFAPIREDDIAEMVAQQIAGYDRRDEILRKWQRIR